jgi:signal transduction histidine kinase
VPKALDQGDASSTQALLAVLADAAVLVNGDGAISAWNQAAAIRFGLHDEDLERPVNEVLGDEADASWAGAYRTALTKSPGTALLLWRAPEVIPDEDDIALQKGDALGRIAGGVLHDVKGKFTALLGFAGLLAAEPGLPEDLRSISSQLEAESADALDSVRAALEFARSWPPRLELVSLGPLVRDLMRLLAHSTINMERRVNVPDALPQVEADPSLLRQALLALLIHAIEAQGAAWGRGAAQVGGRLLISGRELDDARGHRVRLAIEDGASELPADQPGASLSGSPSMRSRRDLAVAAALIDQAGGRLTQEQAVGGHRVVVELPVAGAALTAPPTPAVDVVPSVQPVVATVLVCDEEPLIRGLVVRMIERMGLVAIEARDGREAAEILASRPVSVVIANQRMPHLTGIDLFALAVARQPALATRFILTTGDAGGDETTAFTARTGVPLVSKPFDHARLTMLVREAVGD